MGDENFAVTPELVASLVDKLNVLPSFPLKLSALSEQLGMPVERYFNPEQHDPTFVHDVGGTGLNVGGMPVHHSSAEKTAPLYFELRSRHYARYQTTPGTRPPPFARDDPTVDLIRISGRYDRDPLPKAPEGALREEDTAYHYLAAYQLTKQIPGGYVTLQAEEPDSRSVNHHRWLYEVTTEAGRFLDRAQLEHMQGLLIELLDEAERGEFRRFAPRFDEREAAHKDFIHHTYPLFQLQRVFFVAEEGPFHGAHMAKEGLDEYLRLYVYLLREGGVELPRLGERLGVESVLVSADVPVRENLGAGKLCEGGDLYYNRIKFEAGPFDLSGCGFYPWLPDEEIPTTLRFERIKFQSFNIGRKV